VVTGWLNPHITAAQLAEAGATRISVGGGHDRDEIVRGRQAGVDLKPPEAAVVKSDGGDGILRSERFKATDKLIASLKRQNFIRSQ
jgi:hypothetical protein